MDGANRNLQNEAVIERLIACINGRDLDGMDELFTEDSVMDWPQSGERVVGGDARRAVYGRIARETAYWSEPFDPPSWRSQWVEVTPE